MNKKHLHKVSPYIISIIDDGGLTVFSAVVGTVAILIGSGYCSWERLVVKVLGRNI